MDAHRIHLRGPWECRVPWDSAECVPVKMPGDAATQIPGVGGRVRFERQFQFPAQLSEAEWVDLVFDGVGSVGTVELNGAALGTLVPMESPQRFAVTFKLKKSNRLVVNLELTGYGMTSISPTGLYAPVALEITTREPQQISTDGV